MRSLLALLLAVPALGSSLRGRNLQLDPKPMEGDEVAYIVRFDFSTAEPTENGPTQGDYDKWLESVHDWMTVHVLDPVLLPDPEWAIQRGFGSNGCQSRLIEGSYVAATGKHGILCEFHCKFRQVDSPAPVTFTKALETQAALVVTELVDAIEKPGQTDNSYIWASVLEDVSTSGALSWQPVGSANRDNFDNAYVLPYIITWSLTTDPELATQADFDATVNATKQWVTDYWDAVYPQIPGHQFARRTVDVKPHYSSYSPANELYQQTVSMGVEILIGATNISAVPTVAEYTTTMQLYYRVSNFTKLLHASLPPGSVFAGSERTAFAITPTFEVKLLEDHKNGTNVNDTSVIVVDDLTASSSFAVSLGL